MFAVLVACVHPVFTQLAIASSHPVVNPIPFAIPSCVARWPHPQWQRRREVERTGCAYRRCSVALDTCPQPSVPPFIAAASALGCNLFMSIAFVLSCLLSPAGRLGKIFDLFTSQCQHFVSPVLLGKFAQYSFWICVAADDNDEYALCAWC